MPAKTNQPAANGAAKKYNPTVTAFFDAPKFGKKDENGQGIEGTAFVSTNIDAKAFETIQKHVQIGTKLLLRESARLNKNGGRTFYLEVLPPLADTSKLRGSSRSNSAAEDI